MANTVYGGVPQTVNLTPVDTLTDRVLLVLQDGLVIIVPQVIFYYDIIFKIYYELLL